MTPCTSLMWRITASIVRKVTDMGLNAALGKKDEWEYQHSTTPEQRSRGD